MTAFTVFLVASSHMLSGLFATPGGRNVLLGIAVMLWAFGWTQLKTLLPRKGSGPLPERPGAAQP